MKHFMASVSVLVLAATARAEDYTGALENWAGAVKKIRGSEGDLRGFTQDPKTCTGAIAELKKLGTTSLTSWQYEPFGGKTLTLDQVAKICEEAERWYVLGKHVETFRAVVLQINILEDAPNPDGLKDKTARTLKSCTDAVAEIQAKFPATQPYIVYGVGGAPNPVTTVGALKPELCDTVQGFQDKASAKIAAQKAAALERYKKAGITGDKATFMMEYGANAFLPGGSAPDDLKKYGAASALFVWTSSDPDGDDMVVHTIRRYAFNKANKLTGTKEKTYRKRKGEKLGNAFK